MERIKNDKEAIKFIQMLYDGLPETSEESDEVLGALEDYQTGIASIVIHSSPLPSPEEVLRLARERNKPILL